MTIYRLTMVGLLVASLFPSLASADIAAANAATTVVASSSAAVRAANTQAANDSATQSQTRTSKYQVSTSGQGTNNQAAEINGIAAVVNDTVITQVDLAQQARFIKMQLASRHVNLPSDHELAKQVLSQMINRQLQLTIAKRNNITVSDQQALQSLQQIATNNKTTVANLYREAANYGVSQQYLRQQMKIQLMIEQLQQKAMASQIHISGQQLDNFVRQMANNPQAQKQYHLKDILISLPNNPSSQQIEQAHDRAKVLVDSLDAGADFTKVALAQSDSQSTLENGGDLGWRTVSELPAIFAQQVVKMKPGAVAGPIRSPNGYHIIKLIAVRGGSQAIKHIPQANIGQILLKPTAKRSVEKTLALAQQLEKEINGGADFGQLAKKYSQGQHASNEGYVGWVSLDKNYPQALKEAIDKTTPGQLTQVVIVNQQYYLIKVIGKRQSESISQSQRQQAMNILFQRLMMEKLQSWVDQLRAQAYVMIMPPYEK